MSDKNKKDKIVFKQLNVRIPENVLRDLKIISASTDKKIQDLVTEALGDFIARF